MKTLNPVQFPFEDINYKNGIRKSYDSITDELEAITKKYNDVFIKNDLLVRIAKNKDEKVKSLTLEIEKLKAETSSENLKKVEKKLRNLWLKIIITLLFLVSLLSYFAITESNLIEKAQNLINNF